MTALSRVAPELLAGLEFFPDLDFSQGMAPFRQASPRPPMPVPPGLEAVDVSIRHIPGLNGAPDVKLVLFTPPGMDAPAPGGAPRPAVLHIHGGGYVIGDAETFSGLCRLTAMQHQCLVISVDYRLAPETCWPGSLEDCYAALCWMQAQAGELGIDPARIAVAGESAGGGHAMALALYARDRARDRNSPPIRFLLLDAPMLDDRTGTTADPHPHCGHLVWTAQKNRFGWSALLGMEAGSDAVPAAAVPARASDLSGLPPTFISVGALDLFLEEDIEFARRLTRAGVDVELHVIPGAYHGFGVAAQAPQVSQLMAWRQAALDRAFG